jgi:hypothetical protein
MSTGPLQKASAAASDRLSNGILFQTSVGKFRSGAFLIIRTAFGHLADRRRKRVPNKDLPVV